MLKNFLIVTLFGIGMVLNSEVLNETTLLKQAQKTVKSIDTKQLQALLKEDSNLQLIDVRTKGDILSQGGYIKVNKVTNISRDKLEFLISSEVTPDQKFVLYCYDGKISLLATKQLLEMGYKNVLHYKDSYKGWEKAGLTTSSLDKYLESMLYSKVEKVADGVYTSIGQTSPGSYENSGHNNNLGFVIGNDSVLVWNASSTYLLAKSFHEEIKKITDKPVKYVVLENSQGHAMLGSSYWKEQGAILVSQEIAKEEIIEQGEGILKRYQKTQKDKILGTKIVIPDETFKDKKVFDLGGRIVEALYFGYAHEYSDICIWLPKEKIVFGGDLAFNQRLLPIFKITETKKWLEAWEKFAALGAQKVVPGHGDVTDMATVEKYTKGYLVYMREKITAVIENDGGLNEAYNIDMTPYQHLDTFKELGKQNIATLFKQMEFE
jgi:glyoxylase-like metal-dependent hydrolase (beta-lactamase superfamily II)/rhodanese-related sulfurtransferase